jgi:signal transduction histidine kinase
VTARGKTADAETHRGRRSEYAGSGTRSRRVTDQLAAITAVSRAVSEGSALPDTLNTISRTAASLAEASAAAIILRRHESATGLAVAGSHGLSERYAEDLNRLRPIEMGRGPSGLAAQTRQPVAVSDVLADPLFGPWRNLAVREHYRAMVSVPLQLGSGRRVIGVLNTYRSAPGDWESEEVELLLSLADHAAIAIQTAQLLDESRRQVRGLSLVVRSLRTQSHEHSNLVHAVSGLLALGEVSEARELISTADARYRDAYAAVGENIDNAVVSGFLVAETAIAGNSGIDLRLGEGSRLRRLPPVLTDLDAITILGNLVHNAAEAVADLPADRRRITVHISDGDDALTFRVRDWGCGIPPEEVPRIFHSGYSTKADHVGIGLALVRGIVHRAGGEVQLSKPRGPGTVITIRIPF